MTPKNKQTTTIWKYKMITLKFSIRETRSIMSSRKTLASTFSRSWIMLGDKLNSKRNPLQRSRPSLENYTLGVCFPWSPGSGRQSAACPGILGRVIVLLSGNIPVYRWTTVKKLLWINSSCHSWFLVCLSAWMPEFHILGLSSAWLFVIGPKQVGLGLTIHTVSDPSQFVFAE